MRSASTDTDGLLRRALAAHLVDDPDAPANYSLQLLPAPAPGAPAQPLHRLFEGSRELVRDRSADRVVGALLSALGGFARPDGTHLQVWATALAGAEGAVLVPVQWRGRLPHLQRGLRHTGWRILDAPFVSLDLTSGDVLVADPALTVDVPALQDLLESVPGRGTGSVSPPPWQLRGWLLPPSSGEQALTKAEALVALMPLCRNREKVGGRRAFALLADRLRAVPVARAPRTLGDTDVTDALTRLLDG